MNEFWPDAQRNELYRISGVDLTDIPGVSAATAQVILTEIGTDVSRFRNASAFASWLGLCPEKRVSGGKVLSCKTRQVKHRAATALSMGANSLCRGKVTSASSFGACGPARHGPGDHRHRPQNRTDPLSRLIDQGTVHRNRLPPL
jgi:Transposase IS116/IS110/IS902 family